MDSIPSLHRTRESMAPGAFQEPAKMFGNLAIWQCDSTPVLQLSISTLVTVTTHIANPGNVTPAIWQRDFSRH